jgi:hypothetical protein
MKLLAVTDWVKSWLWLPVIALLCVIASALEDRSEHPRKEAGDSI